MKLVTINGLYKKAFGNLKMADNGVLLNTAYTVHFSNWRQEFLCIFFYGSNKLPLQYVRSEKFLVRKFMKYYKNLFPLRQFCGLIK